MFGLGTLINVAAIILGGIMGALFGKRLTAQHQDGLCKACGICVLFIGIGGALEGMLQLRDGSIVSSGSLLIIGCLALGALIGELLNIEGLLERFGRWLREKTGNSGDRAFVDAFVTATLTVCIGAMAVVGAIEDALQADISILVTKAILDLIIITVMTCSMGKGCVFSAIPVGIFQGSITALAVLLRPVMTAAALANLSMVGSILIFCVGINLVWGKTVRVANMLPAIIVAIVAAFLPF